MKPKEAEVSFQDSKEAKQKQQLLKLRLEGHGHCKEAKRLEARIYESRGQ